MWLLTVVALGRANAGEPDSHPPANPAADATNPPAPTQDAPAPGAPQPAAQPSQPGVQPSQPDAQASQPDAQASQPGAEPSQPAAEASGSAVEAPAPVPAATPPSSASPEAPPAASSASASAAVLPPLPPGVRVVDDPAAPHGWTVLGADGRPLDSRALAAALGDDAAITRLRGDRTRSLVVGGAFAAVGLGLATAGVVELALAGPVVEVGDRPNPQEYPDWTVWRRDTDAWEARMGDADTRDERMWTGVTFLTGAVLAGALVPTTGMDARARAAHPSLVWDRAAIERRLAPAVSIGPDRVQLAWVLP